MKIRSLTAATTLVAAACLLHAPLISAQDDAPPPPPPADEAAPAPNSGPGQSGGDRREQFRQRMNDRLKGYLKASDDEWSVIQPLLEKVQDKQRETYAGRGPGGPGGAPGGDRHRHEGGNNPSGGGDANARPQGGGDPRRGGTPEAQALRSALENESTSTTEIKAKLQAVRDARKKAAADLAAAREDLKKVLNQRQEAILVLAGMLD